VRSTAAQSPDQAPHTQGGSRRTCGCWPTGRGLRQCKLRRTPCTRPISKMANPVRSSCKPVPSLPPHPHQECRGGRRLRSGRRFSLATRQTHRKPLADPARSLAFVREGRVEHRLLVHSQEQHQGARLVVVFHFALPVSITVWCVESIPQFGHECKNFCGLFSTELAKRHALGVFGDYLMRRRLPTGYVAAVGGGRHISRLWLGYRIDPCGDEGEAAQATEGGNPLNWGCRWNLRGQSLYGLIWSLLRGDLRYLHDGLAPALLCLGIQL
jgi:hypothetical protein